MKNSRERARKRPRTGDKPGEGSRPSLRTLADYLKLSPATVSAVINNSPIASTIPHATKERVAEAVRKFDYRANFMARSLRQQRSYMIGVLVPQVTEGFEAQVIAGIEDELLKEGYVYLVASHHHRPDLLKSHPALLLDRSVDGIIAVNTPIETSFPVPVVAISGKCNVDGVTNVVLDHERATTLALEHLYWLGHREIAFLKGQAFSSATEIRWNAMMESAARLNLTISPELCAQLQGDSPPSPISGYVATQSLLSSGKRFTALFAFNDVSALGAIRALREIGLRVPEDVSVVGFDDIPSAAYQTPGLTTIHQPLREMGSRAAEIVLSRIANRQPDPPAKVVLQPTLAVRETTCRCCVLPQKESS